MAKRPKIMTGVVESIDDPTFSGRIKVRIPGVNDNVKTELLPWCTYGGGSIASSVNGGGSISIPRVGSRVRIQYRDENATSVEWYATNNIDPALSERIKQDYAGTHVLLYDKEANLEVMFQPSSGVYIFYKGSYIQIASDNTITLHYGEGTSGTQVQLSDGKVDIQAKTQINLSTQGDINLEAKNIQIGNSLTTNVNFPTNSNKGEDYVVNGAQLKDLIMSLGIIIERKLNVSPGEATSIITSTWSSIQNSLVTMSKK